MGMGDDILVVKRDTLLGGDNFEGFCGIESVNFLQRILDRYEYKSRNEDLENDENHQQIIPYVWIVNKAEKKVFFYVRSVEGDEGRLHNRYSGGVGGHIDKKTEESEIDPVASAMMRELKEEVEMDEYPMPKYVGFINDDSDPVGRVHFGIVAIAQTDKEVKPAEGMSSGRFYQVSEIDALISNPENKFDNWTKISWSFVKEYLES
jgi:predicted NUDIX family phosphoesterase